MTKTEHYQLNQWDAADPIRREDFNADNAKLDAALAAIQQAAESKADAQDVAALNETVAAVAVGLGSVGKNARIAWGSYVGTGTYGASNPSSLTFDFTPMLVAINDTTISGTNISWFGRPFPRTFSTTSYPLTVTWSDHGIGWYYGDSTNPNFNQNNTNGHVYHYLAIGYDA